MHLVQWWRAGLGRGHGTRCEGMSPDILCQVSRARWPDARGRQTALSAARSAIRPGSAAGRRQPVEASNRQVIITWSDSSSAAADR